MEKYLSKASPSSLRTVSPFGLRLTSKDKVRRYLLGEEDANEFKTMIYMMISGVNSWFSSYDQGRWSNMSTTRKSCFEERLWAQGESSEGTPLLSSQGKKVSRIVQLDEASREEVYGLTFTSESLGEGNFPSPRPWQDKSGTLILAASLAIVPDRPKRQSKEEIRWLVPWLIRKVSPLQELTHDYNYVTISSILARSYAFRRESEAKSGLAHELAISMQERLM